MLSIWTSLRFCRLVKDDKGLDELRNFHIYHVFDGF